MTNVGRPTWYSARGSKHQGGINYVPSKQVSAQDVIVQPELKKRKVHQLITREMLENTNKKQEELKPKKIEYKESNDKQKIKEEIKEEIESEDTEEALKKEYEEMEEEEEFSNSSDSQQYFSDGLVQRKWYDDVVFKNQAKEPPKQAKYINDTLRNEYHQHFMDKFIK
ncbi:premRNA-splicing factor, putative [Entamoeba histolytica KU27]|uniref:PremRNA-splicing factor, putative n=1 Tax=Entamoeba histolytica KU27 TaxID=885311 RepID=M2QD37_ENTHI|nr:premRNA-splicing factor, putative [Entamoeba histolytica KU27]